MSPLWPAKDHFESRDGPADPFVHTSGSGKAGKIRHIEGDHGRILLNTLSNGATPSNIQAFHAASGKLHSNFPELNSLMLRSPGGLDLLAE
jgi:hypothetical protein